MPATLANVRQMLLMSTNQLLMRAFYCSVHIVLLRKRTSTQTSQATSTPCTGSIGFKSGKGIQPFRELSLMRASPVANPGP